MPAQGEFVFLDLPDIGDQVGKGEVFGAAESERGVWEFCSPVGGKVVELNEDVDPRDPTAINEDPYGAWLIKLDVTNASDFKDLLTAAQYTDLVSPRQ